MSCMKRGRYEASPVRENDCVTPKKLARKWCEEEAASEDYEAWDVDDVCLFLVRQGHAEVQEAFREHTVKGTTLRYLTEDHLKEMNISPVGKRLQVLHSFRLLCQNANPNMKVEFGLRPSGEYQYAQMRHAFGAQNRGADFYFIYMVVPALYHHLRQSRVNHQSINLPETPSCTPINIILLLRME